MPVFRMFSFLTLQPCIVHTDAAMHLWQGPRQLGQRSIKETKPQIRIALCSKNRCFPIEFLSNIRLAMSNHISCSNIFFLSNFVFIIYCLMSQYILSILCTGRIGNINVCKMFFSVVVHIYNHRNENTSVRSLLFQLSYLLIGWLIGLS